jgi:hypothetical protein
VAVDPKHLPDDPKVLQQMVLDLIAQLDREFAERDKVETLLRELLDARRNRKSEQLTTDQLALFASAWQSRQTEAEASGAGRDDDDDEGTKFGGGQAETRKKSGGRKALPKHLKRERILHDLPDDEKQFPADSAGLWRTELLQSK